MCRYDVDAVHNPIGSGSGISAVASRFGTFMDSVHMFDAAAFGLSSLEAQLMDPQQRMLLEETASTIAASGRSSSQLIASPVGVFVGCIWWALSGV